MKNANAYFNLPGNSEEAFKFYQSIFGGELTIMRFGDLQGDGMSAEGADRDKIAHIALPIGNSLIMATDTLEAWGRPHVTGNNFYICIEPDSADEAQQVFGKLSAGGNVEMPMTKTEWAESYGICADKFGIQWMVNYTGNVMPGGQ
jgi:PhnB protein